MRQTCLAQIHQLARRDPRVVFIGSDLGAGTLQAFRDEFPDRFFMEGVSEANIIGMAAGLALEGFIPYVNTIATFLTRRAFEQTVLDVCLHRLPVRLIGNGGGLVYAPLGPTHEAIEDLAIMRAIPNMTVVAPADAVEMTRIMPATLDWPGPVYVRLAKGNDPVVTADYQVTRLGQAVRVRQGDAALLVTTGVALQVALAAAAQLSAKGLEAAVLHCPTVKPFDTAALVSAAHDIPVVVTIEEHSVIGGLGSVVAETLLEADLDPMPAFRRIGLPDVFPDQYGSQASLMERYGITPAAVGTAVEALAVRRPPRAVQ
jgi:transketolase